MTDAPRVLVVGSIQTVFTADLSSAPGSVSQVRESTAHLMALAKTLDVAQQAAEFLPCFWIQSTVTKVEDEGKVLRLQIADGVQVKATRAAVERLQG